MIPDHPELLSLLHACKQEPDDDTPRLVLSDWLEEHGATALAQLVRLQCRASRMSNRERQHQRVDRRVRELEEACAAEWLQPLRSCGVDPAFRRGLLRVTAFLDRRRDDQVLQLVDNRLWAWVDALALRGGQELPLLRRWLASGLFQGIVSLTLGGTVFGKAAVEALGQNEMPLLRELSLFPDRPGQVRLESFARAPLANRIQTLSLHGFSRNGPAAAAALATGEWANLRQLNCFDNHIGDAGAAALGATSWVSQLGRLDLQSNNIGPAGVRSLLQKPRAVPVGSVLLSNNPIGDEGAAVVAAALSLPDTRVLVLTGCGIGPVGAAALASSPGVQGLTALHLYFNHIGDAGVQALARSPHLANLVALHLSYNGIGDAGAQRWSHTCICHG